MPWFEGSFQTLPDCRLLMMNGLFLQVLSKSMSLWRHCSQIRRCSSTWASRRARSCPLLYLASHSSGTWWVFIRSALSVFGRPRFGFSGRPVGRGGVLLECVHQIVCHTPGQLDCDGAFWP